MKLSFPSKTVLLLSVVLFTFLFAVQASGQTKQYYKRSLEEYKVPDVVLLNQDGQEVALKSYLESDKPIMLDFIYGTCTTICPILSVGFSHFQRKIGETSQGVRLVSITIDPDNDTPELMKKYLAKYNSQPGWDALTGKRSDIIMVLKEFDAYVSNKMNHYPLTLLKAPGENKWVRIYGLLSASDLMKEYKLMQTEQ